MGPRINGVKIHLRKGHFIGDICSLPDTHNVKSKDALFLPTGRCRIKFPP